jgi:hypothetical protein
MARREASVGSMSGIVVAVVGAVASVSAAWITASYKAAPAADKALEQRIGDVDKLRAEIESLRGQLGQAQAVAEVFRILPARRSVVVGGTTWITSLDLSASNGVSTTFEIPKSFAGLVLAHGPGGDQQKVFVVGADGNGDFVNGGFVKPLGDRNQSAMTLERTTNGSWRLVSVTATSPPPLQIQVTLLGTGEPNQ